MNSLRFLWEPTAHGTLLHLPDTPRSRALVTLLGGNLLSSHRPHMIAVRYTAEMDAGVRQLIDQLIDLRYAHPNLMRIRFQDQESR